MTSWHQWQRAVCVAALLLVVSSIHVFSALEIRRLTVPRWVPNGTDEGVILDCEYEYNQNDLRLVIKWFFNDDLEPVYQWIPQLNLRHVSGVLLNRLDMDYSASPTDPYSQYRALKIAKPSTELSGKYTCLIMSLAGQDSKHQEMTVYAPAQRFHFDYTITHDVVNFTCTATSLNPEPRMKIFFFPDGKQRKVFEGESRTTVRNNNNSFDITFWTTPNSRELPEDRVTEVECFVEVFGSPYRRAQRITYVPGVPGNQVFSNPASKAQVCLSTLLLLIFLSWC